MQLSPIWKYITNKYILNLPYKTYNTTPSPASPGDTLFESLRPKTTRTNIRLKNSKFIKLGNEKNRKKCLSRTGKKASTQTSRARRREVGETGRGGCRQPTATAAKGLSSNARKEEAARSVACKTKVNHENT